MNPDYLWLTEALQLLTIFVVGPVIAVAIAYAAWRRRPHNFNPQRYGKLCVASGVSACLLWVLAKYVNADVRTPQYFLQLTCVLLGGLLFGIAMGSFFPVLLHIWHWHKATRLADHDQAGR